MDAQGGLEYLWKVNQECFPKYIDGSVTDFAQVGAEATDDYTWYTPLR